MSDIEDYHLSEENFSDDLDDDFDKLSETDEAPESQLVPTNNHNINKQPLIVSDGSLNKPNRNLLAYFEKNDIDQYFKEFQSLCEVVGISINRAEYPSGLKTISDEQNHISELLENSKPKDFMSIVSVLNDILSFIKIGIESLHAFIEVQ